MKTGRPTVSDCYVIINPAADRGRAGRVRPRMERALRAAGVRHEIVLSEAPGHAIELAESAARAGWSAVFAAGGDGMVHEVANGLLRASGGERTVPMGVVAVGSGNDFVKLLGVPVRDPERAVRAIVTARPRALDVGVVTRFTAGSGPEAPWYFTNGIGLGFDARVAVEASRIRWLRGKAIYALALARTLRRLTSARIRIVIDGVEVADRPLALATIANGGCHGGSFWLTPRAALDDGLLDVLIADARPPTQILALLPRVLRGRPMDAPGMELLQARSVGIRSEEPLPIHADGEIIGAEVTALDVEVVPGSLTVLA